MTGATWYELLRAQGRSWAGVADGPFRGVIAVTRRCNLRCRTCASHAQPTRGEMTGDEILALFRHLPHMTWLDLTGGEPFARPDFPDLLVAAMDLMPRLRVLHFQTNGGFPDAAESAARRVSAQGRGRLVPVTVSIDGPPELHDRLRGQAGSFERAVETVQRLLRVPGVEVYVGTTLGPDNVLQAEATWAALQERLPGLERRRWHWNLVQRSPHFFRNDGTPLLDREVARSRIRQHLAGRLPPATAVDWMEGLFLLGLLRHLQHGRPILPCPALDGSCFVSAEGTLYPCHLWDRPVADLRERGFDLGKAWRLPARKAARAEVARWACGGCFSPCEAYNMIAASPIRGVGQAVLSALDLLREGVSSASGRAP